MQPFILTFEPLANLEPPVNLNKHVFGLREEATVSGENMQNSTQVQL